MRMYKGRNPPTAAASALIGGGTLAPSMQFSRASSAMYFNNGGYTTVGDNVPRFEASGLILEGTRTNQNTNPQFDPSSGTPTGASIASSDPGLTYTWGDRVTMFGVPGILLTVSGVPANALTRPQISSYLPTEALDQVSSFFSVLLSSNGAPVQYSTRLIGGTTVGNGPLMTADVNLTRSYVSTVAATPAVAMTTQHELRYTAGVALNHLFFIGMAQNEQAIFPSSPIVAPAPGITASSTRANDVLSRPLSVNEQTQGTIFIEFMLPVLGGGNRGLLLLDNQSAVNRIGLRIGNSGIPGLFRMASGSYTATPNMAANILPGMTARAAFTWDSISFAASVAGSAVITLPGVSPALNRLMVGYDTPTFGSPLFGYVNRMTLYQTRMPDAQLQAMSV